MLKEKFITSLKAGVELNMNMENGTACHQTVWLKMCKSNVVSSSACPVTANDIKNHNRSHYINGFYMPCARSTHCI